MHLDVLRQARLLHLVRGVRDGRQDLPAELLVRHERVRGVVHRPELRLVHLDRVVQTGPRETLQVFAVRVRAKDQRGVVGEQPVGFRREPRDARVRQVVLVRHERHRPSREVPHQRLAHPAHDLAVNLIRVCGLRVHRVQHERVARLHHGLAQHRHGDVLVRQTCFAAGKHRTLVVLARPHAGYGGPRLSGGAVPAAPPAGASGQGGRSPRTLRASRA